MLALRAVNHCFPPPKARCLGLSCCWPFFLHFVLKASKLERRPCYPFVQADMLSACIEYEDILSDKQRGAHPSPPKGREPDTPPTPPKGGGARDKHYPFRRICYPITSPLTVLVNYPLPWGKATGSCSCKRTKFERASFARVIDEVASLVEEWGWGWASTPPLPWRLHRRVLRIKNPYTRLRRITYPPEHGRYPPLREGRGKFTNSG